MINMKLLQVKDDGGLRIADLKKPVIVRKVDDKKSLVLSLIENIQREDLNAVERLKR